MLNSIAINFSKLYKHTLEMNIFCFRNLFGFFILGLFGLKSASTLLTNRLNILNRNMKLDDAERKSVCVIGGGFGGLYTAISISNKIDKNTDVYLVDPKDNFVFSPLLYELAVGTASSVEVSPQYSNLLKGTNVKLIKAEVSNIDFQQQNCDLKIIDNNDKEGTINIPSTLKYDQLVIATGIQPRTDLIPGAKEHSLPFYRVNDAYKLKSKLKELKASKKDSLSVVVIGGGYSGVEVATNIAQELKKALVTIIDRNETLMITSTTHNRNTAVSSIEKKGIQTLYKTSVKAVLENSIELINESGIEYNLPADLIVFTAGTEQSQFIKNLMIAKDKFGRILVNKSLQSTEYDNVFALGDCSTIENEFNPATAQVAMQQSSEMLTLGDTNAAITSLNGWLKLSGPIAAAGRRAIYAVRMPTITQSVKAFVSASTVTTGKLLSNRFKNK